MLSYVNIEKKKKNKFFFPLKISHKEKYCLFNNQSLKWMSAHTTNIYKKAKATR